MLPVLCILMAYDKFLLESDTTKTAAGRALFQFQQGQWVIKG